MVCFGILPFSTSCWFCSVSFAPAGRSPFCRASVIAGNIWWRSNRDVANAFCICSTVSNCSCSLRSASCAAALRSESCRRSVSRSRICSSSVLSACLIAETSIDREFSRANPTRLPSLSRKYSASSSYRVGFWLPKQILPRRRRAVVIGKTTREWKPLLAYRSSAGRNRVSSWESEITTRCWLDQTQPAGDSRVENSSGSSVCRFSSTMQTCIRSDASSRIA